MLAKKSAPMAYRPRFPVSAKIVEKPVESEYDRLKRISNDVSLGHVISTKGMSRAEFLQLITQK